MGCRRKSGCKTCRVRRIKCDEVRPACRKCISTGRTCDGYDSSFRFPDSNHRLMTVRTGQVQSNTTGTQMTYTSNHISQEDVDLLARDLSIKSICNDTADYETEARQILESSLMDVSTRYAVDSLKLLRYRLENPTNIISEQTLGLQEYISALTGIASIRSPRLVLICCQVFISIEQALKNYSAMVGHIIGGLRLLSEIQARPGSDGELEPAESDRLPRLDVFVVKMFAAPCKFAEPSSIETDKVALLPAAASLPAQPALGHREARLIAPNLRTELVGIATLTLKFLAESSSNHSTDDAPNLGPTEAEILQRLASWYKKYEDIQSRAPDSNGPAPVSTIFLRMFYLALKLVILGASRLPSSCQQEFEITASQLLGVGHSISERLKGYTITI